MMTFFQARDRSLLPILFRLHLGVWADRILDDADFSA